MKGWVAARSSAPLEVRPGGRCSRAVSPADPKKLIDGKLPPDLGIYIQNNLNATFANIDLASVKQGKKPNITTDLSVHQGELAALSPVVIEGIE